MKGSNRMWLEPIMQNVAISLNNRTHCSSLFINGKSNKLMFEFKSLLDALPPKLSLHCIFIERRPSQGPLYSIFTISSD